MNQRAPVEYASFARAQSRHDRAASHVNQPSGPRVRGGRTTIANAVVLGLVLGGLLLCSNAHALIALQDGSTTMTFSTGSTSVSKNSFTVTSGASVLVVLLVDRNNSSANSGPALLTWNGGAAQTITRIASTNGAASTWAWDNVYYLFNPTPGTATITATDSSGGTPSMMAIAAFTLSGVDTAVTPVPYASGVQPVNSLAVALGAGTPAFGWAVVSSSYGTTTGNGWQLSASGGPLTWSYGNNTIQEGMGYVGPLNPGTSTVTGRDASGGTQKIGISVAVFSPYLPGPSAPSGLTTTDGETNKVDLSWTDTSGGAATGFIVWRQPNGGNWSSIATLGAVTSYTDNTAAAWITYNYIVQAVGAAGAGGFSSEATATPVGTPLAPTGVTVVGSGNSAVLNWNAPSGTISYNVLRSTTSGSGYSAVATGVTSTSYTNTSLTLNTAYYYVIQAVNALGTSPNSAEVTVTPLTAPNSFVATGATNKVNLSWADSTGGKATGYLVLRSINSGGGTDGYQKIATLAGNGSTSFTDKTVYTGYTYYYVIEATSSNATSAASSQASASPIWYMPPIAVPIAILDPISTGNFGSGSTTVLMPFSVSAGAAALVFTLFDFNNNASGSFVGPDMVWSNITLGVTQPLTVAGTANSHGFNYSWGSTWYLMNPLPGVGVLIGSESTGAHLGMFSHAYTLVGVDPNTTPDAQGNGAASSTTISVSTSPNTILNSWAQVLAVNYNGGGGNDVVISSSSGGIVQTNYRAFGAQTTFGYITNINPGAGTISATGTGSPTLELLAAEVFAPLVTLSPPTGLTATGQTNQIAVSWNSASGATSYNVLRSTTSGAGYTIIRTNVGNSSVTFTDTSLVNYTTYYYVVQAASASGVSIYSSEVSAYAVGLPAPVSVTAFGDVNQVDLNWAAQTDATSYNVYRSLTGGSGYSLIGSPTSPGFTDTGVVDGTRYYYEVNVVNSFGTGPNSSPVSAIPCAAFLTNYIGNFQGDADVALWGTLSGSTTNSYAAGDFPNGPSAGALEMDATFGPGTTAELNGIAKLFSPNFNISTYNTIEFDMYNFGGSWDQYSQISAVQLNLQVPVAGTPTYVRGNFGDIQLSSAGAGASWTHFVAPVANWNAYDLTQVSAFGINVLDFNYVFGPTLVELRYANIAFCQAPAWIPTFSVGNRTAPGGSTSVVLQGKVSAVVGGTPVYLWTGTPIAVTINGNTQTTTINDATGDFSIAFNLTGFGNGTYPVTYSAASDMVALLGATNSITSLTVGGPPPSRPSIQPLALDNTGTNLAVKVGTQSGYLYYLLTTPSLAPPVVWNTNSVTTGTGGTITQLVPINKAQRALFLRFLVQ
jgi:fibronectin type 3 domain-containing protein